MKKKISVVYSIDYETEIEVDTELEEGVYNVEDILSYGVINESENEYLIAYEIDKLLQNELSNIPIWEDENTTYRENSFDVKSIQV